MFYLASQFCSRFMCEGLLEWIPTDGCFRCSMCGLELWGEGNREVTTLQAQEVYLLQHKTIQKLRKHGGGSKSAGRKRKPSMKHLNPNIVGVQPHFREYDEV